MSSSTKVTRFRVQNVARQAGEVARVRVAKGPDRGSIFVMRDNRVTIGRGEDSDIMIGDLKASRLHAEISAGPGGWMVKDLGSANGIQVNGVVTKSSRIKTSDLLTIGETVLEFVGPDAGTQMIAAPAPGTQLIQQQLMAGQDMKAKPRSLMDPFGLVGGPGQVAAAGGLSKPIKLALVAALGVLAALFLPDEGGKGGNQGKRGPSSVQGSGPGGIEEKQDLESLLPKLAEPPRNKTAEMFFRQGFREFKSRNYLRARSQFELALQIVPDHEMARRYRENCNQAIDDEVKTLIEAGRKSFESGKLREARGFFEAIRRLLSADQSNPAYLEAGDLLKKVTDEQALESGG